VREELERLEEIPHVETRSDTKGRQQPSTKPNPPEREPGSDDNEFDAKDAKRDDKKRASGGKMGESRPGGRSWRKTRPAIPPRNRRPLRNG
jgi:hypothetical protein